MANSSSYGLVSSEFDSIELSRDEQEKKAICAMKPIGLSTCSVDVQHFLILNWLPNMFPKLWSKVKNITSYSTEFSQKLTRQHTSTAQP